MVPTSPPLTREHLLAAINRAELSGFRHFAAALRRLYDRRFGFHTVTGADFARSILWARSQGPNPVTLALREHTNPQPTP